MANRTLKPTPVPDEPEKNKGGRPFVPPDKKLEQFNVRITVAQRTKIEAAGLPAFRAYIDRWKPNRKPKQE